MQWKNNGYLNVMDAVEHKTGMAKDILSSEEYPSFFIQNMDLMAAWIRTYAQQNAPITVIGDFDCDGVCATGGLYLLLRELGADNIRLRLPKRISEGYGLSEKIVDEITEGIVITVDNGITAIPAIQKAKEKGLIVLVIDHHEPKIEGNSIVLPEADLIVDPHVPDSFICKGSLVTSTFNGYCGAGLVYKLAQCLIPNTDTLRKISAFAAIATVADVVPLIWDNRNIYHEGIWNIRNRCITPGLQCLVNILQSNNIVTESDIGFKLAPMLNAPGRLYDDGASKALQTLIVGNYTAASMMAQDLLEINELRKEKKEKAVERAMTIIQKNDLCSSNPIVICDPETEEGIVGLVAGAVCEGFHASAIVFTRTEHGLKGSARAADYNNIKKSLDEFHELYPDILSKYGGHKGAAGLCIPETGFSVFQSEMQKIMGPQHPKQDVIDYDLMINASDIQDVVADIRCFAPFGEGNPPVTVRIHNFRTVPVGKENEFFTVMNKGAVKFAGTGCDAIAFDMADRFIKEGCPTCMDIVGTLGFRNYMGKTKVQVEVQDFIPLEIEDKKKSVQINQSIASILGQLQLSP